MERCRVVAEFEKMPFFSGLAVRVHAVNDFASALEDELAKKFLGPTDRQMTAWGAAGAAAGEPQVRAVISVAL